jgi:hypothetical protein
MQLNKDDLRNVVLHLPKDVRKILTSRAGKVFVGGGFIRAVVGQEKISDIDMFGGDLVELAMVAQKLTSDRGTSCRSHKTKNAITILTENRLPVQFINSNATDLVKSFDFTVCQAVIYYENGEFHSVTNEHFYADLAAKRLRYTFPQREEEAGGSMLRAVKYVKRGYSISPESLGGVMARVTKSIIDHDNFSVHYSTEQQIAKLTQAKLREVDPLLIIDGLDLIDDHEMPDEDETKSIPAAQYNDDKPF